MLNPSEFVKETRIAFKGKWADSLIASILSNILASTLVIYYSVLFTIVLLPFTLINHNESEYDAYRDIIRFFKHFRFFLNFLLNCIEAIFRLVYNVRIQTHDLLIMSHLPYPLDHATRQ